MSEDQDEVQEQEAKPEAVQEEKVKGKAKATGDLIADVAFEIEHLNKTKALNLAASLSENIEANYFKLGGVLKVISDNSWFEGFESFDVFVFEKFGFQSRKARYLMQIYEDLVTKQIPWEKVHHLGWTKLKDLAPILTLENLEEWVAKAEIMTVLELQAALKAKPDNASSTPTTDEIVTLKYKVKNDQAETINHALAKAKGECQTEFDTVALENICALYLSGNMGAAGTGGDLKAAMAESGWEAVLTLFGELYPTIDLQVTMPETPEA
jgi:hypothetical protein